MGKRGARVFSGAFEQGMVQRVEGGERVISVAEEAGLRPKLLYDWLALYRTLGAAGLNRKRGRKAGWNRTGLASSEPSSSSDAGLAAATPAAKPAARPADELARAKARIGELERVVGRQQADLHFFREALRLWDATAQDSSASASTRSSKK
jgi:hypothetical protein